MEDVLGTAREVLDASLPPEFHDETLTRLERSELSESRKQLIFNYKLAFDSHRRATEA